MRFRTRRFAPLLAAVLVCSSPLLAQEMADDGMEMDSMPMDTMGMDTMGMGGMDMSAMLRPDAAPPTGVLGGMNPPAGRLMPSLTYMHMSMDGNRNGTDEVTTA